MIEPQSYNPVKGYSLMKRLVMALGTWQLVVVAAALRQTRVEQGIESEDYLVLYGYKLSDRLKDWMTHLAEHLWAWEKLMWVESPPNLATATIDSDQLASVYQHTNGLDVDEIWVCKVCEWFEKQMIDAYPRSKIVVYEDGTLNYIPKAYTCSFNLLTLIRPQRLIRQTLRGFAHHPQHCLREQGICAKQISRLEKSFLCLSPMLPVPKYLSRSPVFPIKTTYLLESIEAAARLWSNKQPLLPEALNQQDVMLVLGSCYNKWLLMSWEHELEVYYRAIHLLLERGYAVVWKEHPRIDQPFFPELDKRTRSERFKELKAPLELPVELFVSELPLVGCVAPISTSLFYLRQVFDIPTYTFAHWLKFDKYSIEIEFVRRLVRKYIPSIEVLDM